MDELSSDVVPYTDVIRRQDGTADWRLNFDNLYQQYHAARDHFKRRVICDHVLIGFLVRLRHKAKREKQWELADTIKRVLATADVELQDRPGVTRWRIKCSLDGGEIPTSEEEAGT